MPESFFNKNVLKLKKVRKKVGKGSRSIALRFFKIFFLLLFFCSSGSDKGNIFWSSDIDSLC